MLESAAAAFVAYSAVSVRPKKYVGGVEVEFHPFLTTDYMDVGGQFHSLAGLPPWSERR
jgi:hypothetical protein